MIRDRNLDPTAAAFQQVVAIPFSAGAALAGVQVAAVRLPFPGKILSAHVHASTLTDADDSVRVDLHKGAASILGATVDPVAADTTTSLAPTTTTFAAGDVLKVVVTTGAGDALAGTVTLVVRPYLGSPERYAAKASGVSLVP